MLVEPITDTGNRMVPSAQARLPAEMGMIQNEKSAKEAEKQVEMANSAHLEELAADLQKNLKIMHNVDLQFSVHETSGQVMVIVRDESSGKVIREIPPKEVLNLAAKFDEMIGLILDKQG
ncbi:MAG: flagellar protein FlaG [Proteobacteria bacterium]|nr:flagellar protein FlaG [Pseudomonadota bacterium]